VSAVYLLCLDDEGFLTAEELTLLRCFRDADERGRRTILAVAEAQSAAGGAEGAPLARSAV
jgi:hypothetical protein